MKYFDNWNSLKKNIEEYSRISISTGSIWLCNLGVNVGYEIDGKNDDYTRPVLVILGFGKGGGIVLPLSTKSKKSQFFKQISPESFVNLTQVRYVDAKRFKRFIKNIPTQIFSEIIKDFICLFNNEKPPRSVD